MSNNIIEAYTPLKQADFSIINQDNRVVTDRVNGVDISGAAKSSANSVCSLVKTVPTAPYSFTVHLLNLGVTTSSKDYGICLRDSANSKLIL